MQSLCLNEPKKARRLKSNLRLIISPKIYLGILNRKAKAGEEQAKEALKAKAVKAERVSERAEKAKVIKMEPE